MINSVKIPFKTTRDLLQAIQNRQKYKLECEEDTLNGKNAELWYDINESRFKIGIASHTFCSLAVRERTVGSNIDLKIQNSDYSATLNFSKSFLGWTLSFPSGTVDLENTIFITFDIHQFLLASTKLPKCTAKRQRCVINKKASKVSFSPSHYFHLGHQYLDLEDIKCGNSGGALELSLNGNIFTIFSHGNSLVIDNLNYMGSEFSEIVESILLALAFLTGEYLSDDKYVIDFGDDEFRLPLSIQYTKRFRSEDLHYGFYPSVTLQRSFGIEENKLMYLDPMFFGKIVNTIHVDSDYRRCVSILTELYDTSPNGQSILLSVALETICEMVSRNNDKNIKPVKDKEISKQVISDLKSTLDKYVSVIDEIGLSILVKKLDNINSPTNQDKLFYPFSLYGITLNAKEKAAIQERNNILHGLGVKPKDIPDYTEQSVCQLLRFCVSILLAKYLNYYGPFLCHSTLQELMQKKEPSDYLIKII